MPRKNQRSLAQQLRWNKPKDCDLAATDEQQLDVPQSSEKVKVDRPDVRRVAAPVSYADALNGRHSDFIPNSHQNAAAGPSQVSGFNVHLPSETSVRATRSQASTIYGMYRNKQCAANSLVFLSFLHENEAISSADLNLVLDKGHVMYTQARRLYPASVHLATDELPGEVTARTSHYHVNMRVTGIRNGKFLGGDLPSLAEGLNCLTSEFQYCLLIMAGNCVAVFRTTSGQYGYFDPHKRNAHGIPVKHKPGTAIMLKFTCLPDMINRITYSYRRIGVSGSTHYEIQSVDFQSDTAGSAAAEANPFTENVGLVTTEQTGNQQVTSVTQDCTPDQSNLTAEVMNPAGPSVRSHISMTSSVRETVTVPEPSNQDNHTEPEAACEPSAAVGQTTDSVTQEMLHKLSKRNKQEKKKLLRKLSVSEKKPSQRKENQKKRERELYATDESFNSKKKTYSRSSYENSPDVRQEKSVYNKNLYRKNAKYREKQKNNIRTSYREKADYREKQKLYMRTLYRECEQYRQKKKSNMKTVYRECEDVRQRKKSNMKTLYRECEDVRQRKKSNMKTLYRECEDVRQRKKSYIRTLYRKCEQFRQKQKSYIRTLYRKCEQFRQKQKSYIKEHYANDLPYRLRHRELMKELMRVYYNNSELFRMSHNSRCASNIKRKYRQRNLHIQRVEGETQTSVSSEPVSVCETENPLMSEAIAVFRSNIKSGPTYVCTSCEKASFLNQVKLCKRSSFTKYPSISSQCLTGKFLHECSDSCIQPCSVPVERTKEWICHTCHDHIKKGSIPRLSVANQMGLSEIPQELKDLNILERHLISKCIPFAKIIPLPKGRQRQIRGNLVCVPSEVQETVDALPRLRSESQVMRVKLKRKLCYKGHQLFQTVTWSKLIHALLTLKQIHPQYADITIRDDAMQCDPTVDDDDDDEDDSSMDCDDYDEDDLMQIDDFEQNAETEAASDVESEQDMSSDDNEQQNVQNDEGQDSDLPNGGFALESCLQPVDIAEEILCFSDSTYCVAPAERNSPVSFFRTPHLEAMAFPVQFPTGQNTLDERRRIKVTPSSYFKSRLFNIDDRFARDPNYLFFAQFVTEIHLANSSMTIQLRKGKAVSRDGRRITSSMLQDTHEVQRLVRNKDAVRFMQTLRGTPAYWQKTTKDLFAMIRQLGTPTFFCTFSAAEMRWSEIITAIKKQQGEQVDFENLDWSAKCEILRSNPVTTMRMFDKRVEALFRDLLLSAAQPLGEIVDYFYRVEFQHRGSPHIHMMLWVQNAPECDVDSDQTVCDFVDRYISAQLPDPETQPELHKKVTEVQKHSRNHTRTCFKNVNSGCRFGFPKPPCNRTMISRFDEEQEQDPAAAKQKLAPLMSLLNEPEAASLSLDQILSRCNLTMDEYEQCIQCMNKKTALILKRDAKDSWINNYNPHLLEAWDSNIDVSFILNAYSCVVYLTKYITKKESGLSDYLTTVISSSNMDGVNDSTEMKAVMQAYSKKREISSQECVTRACGLKMKKCSRSVVFVPTDDNPVKMSRPMSFLENTTPDSCNIWMTSLNDKYKSRPETPEYEEMCLADFAATCRFVSGQQNVREDVLPLLNELGFVQRRQNNKPCVIRFYQCSKEKNPEEFYGRLLRLYLPHRSEEELKSRRFQTHQSYYESGWVRLPGSEHTEYVKEIVSRNQDKYERYSEDIESALEEYEQDRAEGCDEWSNLAPESDVVRLQCDDQPENQQEDVPDYCVPPAAEVRAVRETPAIDPTVLRQMYQNLNQKQACVFYAVRDWCIKRVCGLNPDPFFFFLHGGAGTGKSHLIKCIHSEASKILSRLPAEDVDLSNPTVLLTSFTGTAAFNIGGTTLHSLLKLPRSLKPPIQGLGNQLDEVRCELLNVEILVIDEISMVSKPLFAYVDARLKQIKGNQKPFGGMSVLAVGDFYQLPPVRQSKPLCVYDPSHIDLWQQYFQMITLTEIMRQKDDVAFAEMLNRIRVKEKTAELSPADRDMLSRTITEPELCPSAVLHIFATNKDVEAHNTATLERLHDNIITINADDFQKDPRTGRMERKETPLKGGKGDLPDCLKVAEGARVMLTRNINVQDGLVNGAFGKLVRVVSSESDAQHIVKLGLRMDNQSSVRNNQRGASGSDDLVYIDRAEDNLKQRGGVRRQFPVKLAFSCTVHKTQGLTTHAAVVSLKSIFEPGMAYVALSRVTSLSGLYLLGLDETKIYANPDVTAALQSMRQASVDHIMPLLLVREAVSRPDTLTLIHHNTEGLPAHINDIKSHHELCLADVLCLTETHLQGSFVAESLLLDGYTMFKRNRHLSYTKFPEMASRSGGGVAVYVKNHIQVREKQYLHNVTDLEFLVLKVETPFPALIAVIYRPPDYSLRPFMQNLVSLLDSLEVMDCHPVIVCGDFNENQLIGGRKQILEHFQSRGYAQLITSATTDKNTLLDLVFISQPQWSRHCGVLRAYYSYHEPVFCVLGPSQS